MEQQINRIVMMWNGWSNSNWNLHTKISQHGDRNLTMHFSSESWNPEIHIKIFFLFDYCHLNPKIVFHLIFIMKTVKINVIKYLNLMFHTPSPLIVLKRSSIVEELTRKKCERRRMKQTVELSGWIDCGRKWVGEDTIMK